MLSSTVPDATPRLYLDTPSRAGEPPLGTIGAHALAAGLCSPAGMHRRPWLARLRRALRDGLFVLHFQPIVRVSDRHVCHHEALLRLIDEPGVPPIVPGRFLPAAERYGLIREIDRMVIERVARLLGADADAELLTSVAVNVSALSVTDATMLAYLQQRLEHHAVDPGRLVLEVTETAAISNMDSARAFCQGVLDLGCGLALDDFGAGFGSFQYLRHLPFSYLKIDGEFIRGLPASRTDQLLVRALAGVVRDMGAQTIAEFVGDEATLGMLHDYGVDYAQGFAVGRPRAGLPLATPSAVSR
jgi:EAL domain-containing protein (putative c-di-GMP-specific phosphodiesterase class I)